LGDAGSLYDGGPLLPFGKAGGFVVVCVHAAKPLSIRVEHGNEPVMMLATPIFPKGWFLFSHSLQDRLPAEATFARHYRSFSLPAQVPREIVSFWQQTCAEGDDASPVELSSTERTGPPARSCDAPPELGRRALVSLLQTAASKRSSSATNAGSQKRFLRSVSNACKWFYINHIQKCGERLAEMGLAQAAWLARRRIQLILNCIPMSGSFETFSLFFRLYVQKGRKDLSRNRQARWTSRKIRLSSKTWETTQRSSSQNFGCCSKWVRLHGRTLAAPVFTKSKGCLTSTTFSAILPARRSSCSVFGRRTLWRRWFPVPARRPELVPFQLIRPNTRCPYLPAASSLRRKELASKSWNGTSTPKRIWAMADAPIALHFRKSYSASSKSSATELMQ